MRLERLHIGIFLAIAVLVWGSILVVQGEQVGWEHLKPFGAVVGVLGFLALLFEKKLWCQPWLHGWFVKRPDLRGTWRVKLQSDWVDDNTGNRTPLIICYMGVTQSLSDLQMHLMTRESESSSIAYSIEASRSGKGYLIAAVYRNEPGIFLRGERSEMHYGGMILETHGDQVSRPKVLRGEFWTDRNTKGEMKLECRKSELFTNFDDASEAFGTK